MILDALDGTTGRRVWRVGTDPPTFVIAGSEAAAREWLRGRAGQLADTMPVDDVGDADRTEIAIWRDESRLTGGGAWR